ncbi:putative lrr receptor-like serine/threonine-protein kinase [Quercus suber]|uniref:Lrr receptor-like serine/threonine-protein kinase n=1 Tax=Quercus suber TaxID=58331 RepID=A0AAW0MAL5_QUESU
MSLKMELFFAILILACLPSIVLSDAQGDALNALKISLKASPSQLTSWNPNQVNPCTWVDITVINGI